MSLVEQVPVGLLCAAFLAFLAKHFVADFMLQSTWMVQGKEQASHWFAPLLAHAAVHGALTAFVFLYFVPSYAWLGAVDFLIHFVIDRAKAHATRMAGATPTRPIFWWLLGLDQSLHHLTHFAFVIIIAMNSN